MKPLLLFLAFSLSALAQIGTPAGSNSSSASASTPASGAHTTTTGDALFVFWGESTPCSSVNTLNRPTDTGGDTFVPVYPSNGGPVLGVRVTNVGNGYLTTPSCTISNAGAATCSDIISGGQISSVTITSQGTPTTTVPTITLGAPAGGSPVQATAAFTAYGQNSGSTFCTSAWTSIVGTGTTNNVVSTDASTTFNGVNVAEVTLSPGTVDVTAGNSVASGASITSNSFTTTNANDIILCGSRVQNTSNTWTAGLIGGVSSAQVSGATPGGANNYQTIEFLTVSSIQTSITAAISSSPNAARTMICAALEGTGASGAVANPSAFGIAVNDLFPEFEPFLQ